MKTYNSRIPDKEINEAIKSNNGDALAAYDSLVKKYGYVEHLRGRICSYIETEKQREEALKKAAKKTVNSNVGATIQPEMLQYFVMTKDRHNGGYSIQIRRYYENNYCFEEYQNEEVASIRMQELANQALNDMRKYVKIPDSKIASKDFDTIKMWKRYVAVYDAVKEENPKAFERLSKNDNGLAGYMNISELDTRYYGILSPKMIGHINLLDPNANREVRDSMNQYTLGETELHDFDERFTMVAKSVMPIKKSKTESQKTLKKQR